MANRTKHRSKPEGRRFPAPPRRLPPPANDNFAPHRRRIQRALVFAALLIAALALGLTLA